MLSAERTRVADCCGATLIHNFSGSGERGPGIKSFQAGHLYFCVLTEYQSNLHSKTLTETGFRIVSKTVRNSNTGNLLYMWVRDREKAKKLKKRMFK